ncbi:unnamed protein product (macronuclear) [Paramecium tetraurelia]|uniref:Uncharacterized protein n=1 Tax=Paramecium tetraurelia TaxID=5888 RepID=A0BUP3_PARTE|nr:uncharacterized protein GSPATT00005506001 [Paramecium tetraurelia]CAK62260.1 unnamed protein product [Paramecium tetraurelia]|eukprot:XP_001429658.1 hypothetical protein (macronuclear) [Paramecium tetraurelia strain d4-2]
MSASIYTLLSIYSKILAFNIIFEDLPLLETHFTPNNLKTTESNSKLYQLLSHIEIEQESFANAFKCTIILDQSIHIIMYDYGLILTAFRNQG